MLSIKGAIRTPICCLRGDHLVQLSSLLVLRGSLTLFTLKYVDCHCFLRCNLVVIVHLCFDGSALLAVFYVLLGCAIVRSDCYKKGVVRV